VTRFLPLCWAALLLAPSAHAADPPGVAFETKPDRLVVTAGGPLATYVFDDPAIPRPYFAHLHAPGGIRVSRNHPPVKGKDADDHATFHPGLWLAFGDLSGADSWRLKAPVRHDGFAEKPRGRPGEGGFAVRNRYLAADGKTTLCRETCRVRVLVRPAGYLIVWDSTFEPEAAEVAFGDQEEMGLGVRVATPLAVKTGGRMTGSGGEQNEAGVRGKPLDWCDYSGTVDGKPAGVMLMPDPGNFRPSWFHARDYGFVAANPFGRKSVGRGEASRVVVKRGEPLRLRFGVLLHSGETDRKAAYRDFLAQIQGDPKR
jgi:hypothetical protein